MAESVRNKLKTLMTATISDHSNWTYRAIRPLTPPSTWHKGQHVVGDCSKGVQYLCRWAGAPDPMGNNWGEWGNSQTLWSHLQHVSHPSELDVGDIITFGHDGDKHAAMVYEPGNDPVMWSFGHQGTPETYRLSQDGRPAQFLRMPLPKYVKTPVEKLRAKTGYFAWVSWRLGEGDWKPYGQANKVVRPNVPKLIPLSWWRRLARFLINRKKAIESGR